MAHNGWRKPTSGLVVAEQHAQAGERLSVPKSQAVGAVKKVATAIGLKSPQLSLLDTLAAVTKEQDWETGRRPIVWPSNAFLMEQCGFSLAALRRHVRRLCEAGVISMQDSPNGKRWGKRDEDGHIVEAYGFDLSPMAARAQEFEAMHAHIVEERALCKSLRNTITITRRRIRAKIEKAIESRLRGPWRELNEEFALMLQRLPRPTDRSDKLLDLVDWFNALREKVEDAFAAAFDWPENSDTDSVNRGTEAIEVQASNSQKMTPTGVAGEGHLLTTNQPHFVNSNCFENKAAAAAPPEPEPLPSVEAEREEPEQLDDIEWSSHRNSGRNTQVELTTVMAACPGFAEMARAMAGGYIRNWDDLHRAAASMRPMVGISENAWNVAQKNLGPLPAAAALALIYDKYDRGEINSPGGYLRGIVAKALDGELHLERSFYGRISERRV